MKGMILSAMMVATGGMVLAQPAAPVAAAPVAAAPVAAAPVMTVTNDVKTDMAKMQAVYAELGAINKELRARETQLMMEDAELKALAEKKNAAQLVLKDLEDQRRAMVDAKLKADPKLKDMVEKRQELQKTLQELRPASPMGMGVPGFHKKPMEGMAPKIMPPPAAAPADTTKK